MKHDYHDIVGKLGAPLWWDENGTPRYLPFHPDMTPNIYSRETCLMQIRCQECGTLFDVQLSSSIIHHTRLAEMAADHRLHYGDPPNSAHGTTECAAGPTMNSIPVRVKEFWVRNRLDWERKPELEVDIEGKK